MTTPIAATATTDTTATTTTTFDTDLSPRSITGPFMTTTKPSMNDNIEIQTTSSTHRKVSQDTIPSSKNDATIVPGLTPTAHDKNTPNVDKTAAAATATTTTMTPTASNDDDDRRDQVSPGGAAADGSGGRSGGAAHPAPPSSSAYPPPPPPPHQLATPQQQPHAVHSVPFYYNNYGMTPEPPSPNIVNAAAVSGAAYDFFPGNTTTAGPSPFGNTGAPPLSPLRHSNPSVLFPRMDRASSNASNAAAPPNLNPAYANMNSSHQNNSMYYGNSNNSPEDGTGGGGTGGNAWARQQQQQQHHGSFPHGSPHASMPMYGGGVANNTTRAGANHRAYSFEGEAMLPPSALDNSNHTNDPAAYSPYGGHSPQIVGGTGPGGGPGSGTLFAHAAWNNTPTTVSSGGGGGGGGAGHTMANAAGAYPLDMYAINNTTSGSPLQPRPSAMHHHHLHVPPPQPPHYGPMPAPPPPMPGGAGMRGPGMGGPYGAYFPASSPGPPIQTTASNKGPDGANLFIFHIPNHFTNLDMYQLFCPYGNLLSVRIMVEKDTGRSRGFGFVSYDSPESAALAIKELNGFAIGNKRLKVQHKQIRPKDLHDHDFGNVSPTPPPTYASQQFGGAPSLPPAAPGPGGEPGPTSLWYEAESAGHDGAGGPPTSVTAADYGKQDEGTERTMSSTTGETTIGATNSGSSDTVTTSPLASLQSLQQALPETTTTTAPVKNGAAAAAAAVGE